MKPETEKYELLHADGFALDLAADGSVPTEIQVFHAGLVEFTSTSGIAPVLVDDQGQADAVAAFAVRAHDLVFDWEHQTLPGENTRPDGLAPAAGWIKQLIARGADGLWAVVEWTAVARDYLARKEYRFQSPVFLRNKVTGRLAEILSLALTNNPATLGQKPLVAKDESGAASPPAATPQEVSMDLLQELVKLLGLVADAKPEDVLAKVKALNDAQPAAATAAKDLTLVRESLGIAKDAPMAEVTGTIAAFRARPGQELVTEVASLRAKIAGQEAEKLVSAAAAEGKITPALMDWARDFAAKDPEGFKVFVAKSIPIVPLAPAHGDEPPKSNLLTAEQIEINRRTGVSDEDYRKLYPQAQA